MFHRFGRRRSLVFLLAVLGAGGFWAWPSDTPARPNQNGDGASILSLSEWPLTQSAVRGKVVYDKYCGGCHGDEGAGDGAAAAYLNPLPRNFQKATFKFRSTPSGQLPTEADLMRTITCGLPGSSMPGFNLVSEPQRRDVVNYVLHIATLRAGRNAIEEEMNNRGKNAEQVKKDHLAAIKEAVWRDKVLNVKSIPVPPSPEVTPDLLAAGKTRYLAECSKCHGDTGKGDGSSSYTLRDWRDAEIRARDFTNGVFRAGSAPADLYLRLRTGLSGTPMPAIAGEDREIWALVHYMLSLRSPSALKPNPLVGCAEGGHAK